MRNSQIGLNSKCQAVPSLPILSYPELSRGTATVNALGQIEDGPDPTAVPAGVGANSGNTLS